MQLQTILHRVHKCKGFCYAKACFCEVESTSVSSPSEAASARFVIEVDVRPRKGSRGICSGCGQKRAGYDRLRQSRRYEFVPLWNIPVFLVYCPRRVDCPDCGVKVEQVPWSQGKQTQTTVYAWFLASWASLLAWQTVAKRFRSSWDTVYRCVQAAVFWGLEHRSLDGVESIGVDEIQWRRGHDYLTLVYQIDAGKKRLLHAEPKRTKESLKKFFWMMGQERSLELKFACSDMWQPYMDVIDRYSYATNILDRFHVMKKFNEAIDEIRRQERREAKAAGYEAVLKGSRWVLLKNKENLTQKQVVKLKELLKYNIPAVKAYLLREDFQRFWQYKQRRWAERFLREWIARVRKTDLEPMKKVAGMLESHAELILNWFDAGGRLSSGIVEGLNYNVKLAMRKAYGFRSLDVMKTVLYHQLGDLPQQKFTHSFC